MKRFGIKMKDDLDAVVVPLLIVLGGAVVLALAIAALWAMGVLGVALGVGFIFLGALFALQILPPRGWLGVIVGAVPMVVGLVIVFVLH